MRRGHIPCMSCIIPLFWCPIFISHTTSFHNGPQMKKGRSAMRNMNTYSKQNVYGKRIVYICPDGADPEAITRRYTLLSFLCIWSHLAFSASRSLFFCRANTKHSLPPSSCNQQTKQSVVQSGRPTKCGVVVVGSHTIHVLYYPIVLVSPYVFHIQ